MPYIFYDNSPKLKHYGIKGQRWGERRYQYKDGSLTPEGRKRYSKVYDDDVVIRKGTKVGHVTLTRDLDVNDDKMYLFDRDNQTDKDIYEGAFAKGMKLVNPSSTRVYEQQYETTEDLFSPSESRRKQIFEEIYSNNKELLDTHLNEVERRLKDAIWGNDLELDAPEAVTEMVNKYATHKVKSDSILELGRLEDLDGIDGLDGLVGLEKLDKAREINMENIERGTFNSSTKANSETVREYGYGLYNVGYGRHYGKYQEVTDLYLNKLKDMGYSALIDDNNRGIYNGAVQPFISLYANTSLKKVDTIELSDADINRAVEEVEKRLGQKGVIY